MKDKNIAPHSVPSGRRIDELDALRGIASIAVSFAHFHVGSAFLERVGLYSQHGVELFFLISGFVIFMTMRKKQNILDFAVARFARLYPAYLLSVGLVALLASFFAAYMTNPPSTKIFLYNLMIWHPLFHVQSVSDVYWTLWVEVRFYALMSVLLIFHKTEKIEVFLWIWLIFIGGYELAGHILTGGIWKIYYLSPVYAMAIPDYAHYFISGIIFYKIFNNEARLCHWMLLILCLSREFYLFSFHKTPVVLCCYGIFFLLINGKLNFLSRKSFVFLGKISYSLYLVHQVLGSVTIRWMSVNTSSGPAIQFIAAEIISILVAIAITFSVEYPLMSFIRKAYRHIRPRLFGYEERAIACMIE